MRIDRRQLQAKFKHANDFGIEGSYNPVRAEAFADVLHAHVASESTRVIHGTFRGRHSVVLNVDPHTGLALFTDEDGDFLSGWRLSGSQLNHVLRRGTL